MVDPLSQAVTLLRPRAPSSKVVSAAGRWRVTRQEHGRPFYCAVLEGTSGLVVGDRALELQGGDFVLIPAAFDFVLTSPEPPRAGEETPHTLLANREMRHGRRTGLPDVRMLVGYCTFTSPNADLLVSLLPQLVHVRDQPRLSTLVELVVDECRADRPARDVVLAGLLEVLFVEAFRSFDGATAPAGLLRGLADKQVAVALRRMHEDPSQHWTAGRLAAEASLSRSTFFARFDQTVGTSPMDYLTAWRIAIAKDLLTRDRMPVTEVARRVGYRSSSAFSVAFARHVGMPPSAFAADLTDPTV